MTANESSATSRSVLGTLGLVLMAMIGLSIVDAFLARTERSENRAEAERLSAEGQRLLESGHPLDAVAQFKSALGTERENAGYWLALGEAQFAAGELADAEATLTELLGRDSTSGPANLALARVLVKEGRITDAVSTYHRAIYGQWKQDAEKNRVGVRFELVNLLGQQGSKEDLLAELLPLLDVAPEDLAERKRIGRLFLIAGSATRAGDIFREILRHHPQDADAYAGLAESEFVRGNYQTAHNEFQVAANLKPSDEEVVARLKLCTEILDLDPMRRGLGPEEQYRRSLKMVELASAAAGECGSPVTAEKALKGVEANLDLAERLWKIRMQECKKAPTAEEEPLRLVLGKIAQ